MIPRRCQTLAHKYVDISAVFRLTVKSNESKATRTRVRVNYYAGRVSWPISHLTQFNSLPSRLARPFFATGTDVARPIGRA